VDGISAIIQRPSTTAGPRGLAHAASEYWTSSVFRVRWTNKLSVAGKTTLLPMILGQQQPAYLPKADALTGAGAAMVDDDALEVIRQPERTVWAAGWHLQEQSVLERPAGTAARAGRPAAAV